MKRIIKDFGILLLVISMILSMAAGGAYAKVRYTMMTTGQSYSDTVEKMIAGLVPDEGITIHGRYYGYWDVITFLDEVRWVPDNYVHKDHHCVLAQLPKEEVKVLVKILRLIMRCG